MRFKILLPWALLAGVLVWLWTQHAPSVIPHVTPSLPAERTPVVAAAPVSGPVSYAAAVQVGAQRPRRLDARTADVLPRSAPP